MTMRSPLLAMCPCEHHNKTGTVDRYQNPHNGPEHDWIFNKAHVIMLLQRDRYEVKGEVVTPWMLVNAGFTDQLLKTCFITLESSSFFFLSILRVTSAHISFRGGRARPSQVCYRHQSEPSEPKECPIVVFSFFKVFVSFSGIQSIIGQRDNLCDVHVENRWLWALFYAFFYV